MDWIVQYVFIKLREEVNTKYSFKEKKKVVNYMGLYW